VATEKVVVSAVAPPQLAEGSLNAMGAHELARQRENEGRAKVPAAVQKNEKPKFPLPERKIARVALIGVPI